MKKIIVCWLSSLALIWYTFAQSTGSFEATYARLIDQIAIETPTATLNSALATSGNSIFTLIINAGPEGSWKIQFNLDYTTITSMSKNQKTNTEASVKLQGLFDGNIGDIKIDNLWVNIAGDITVTSRMMYFRLRAFTIDTSKLPTEMQGYGEMIAGYIKSTILNKWIKQPITKDMNVTLALSADGEKISPQLMVNLIKQYPIVKNISYINNNYNLKLNEKNIAKVINQINTLQWKEELSRKDMQAMKKSLSKIKVQNATLSDTISPVLTMSMQTTVPDNWSANLKTTISEKWITIFGSLQEDSNWSGTMNMSIQKTSPSRMDYHMDIGYSEGTYYDININEPFSFSMILDGYESFWLINNYIFSKPKKAMSTRQLEKGIESLNF